MSLVRGITVTQVGPLKTPPSLFVVMKYQPALLLAVASAHSAVEDISTAVGSDKWWDTDMDPQDFSLKAQDPEYLIKNAQTEAQQKERLHESAVEAAYVMDTEWDYSDPK